MTKTYALKRLLEHGELRFREIVEITGWKPSEAWSAIQCLMRKEIVSSDGIYQRTVYRLAE